MGILFNYKHTTLNRVIMEGYHPSIDHNQILSGNRFTHVPGNRPNLHLADQMEAGGAKIEEALNRINCKYQTLFFISAWGITLASILAMVNSVITIAPASFLSAGFQFFFGTIMLIIDIPGTPRWAAKHRSIARKHARFLSRLTGKSLFFLYLSTMVSLTLWPNTRNTHRWGLMLMSSFCTSSFVFFVALIGLFIAMRKSLRLERIRKNLNNHFRGNQHELYRKYAVTDPAHGIQMEEFNRMACDYSQGQVTFNLVDLAIIFNALDNHQKNSINEREFVEWLSSSIVYL